MPWGGTTVAVAGAMRVSDAQPRAHRHMPEVTIVYRAKSFSTLYPSSAATAQNLLVCHDACRLSCISALVQSLFIFRAERKKASSSIHCIADPLRVHVDCVSLNAVDRRDIPCRSERE